MLKDVGGKGGEGGVVCTTYMCTTRWVAESDSSVPACPM
jgi:hypothetical protein